jgi:aspartate aminotransferase
MVSPKIADSESVYHAIAGAGRSLGFVCAPSLLQKAIPIILSLKVDTSVYDKNRWLLYNALTEYGFEAIRPDGAFYLFIKTPEEDSRAFCERAKSYEILVVPGDDFGAPGYARISYCVTTEIIEGSLPAFVAAFAKKKELKKEQIEEILRIIEEG